MSHKPAGIGHSTIFAIFGVSAPKKGMRIGAGKVKHAHLAIKHLSAEILALLDQLDQGVYDKQILSAYYAADMERLIACAQHLRELNSHNLVAVTKKHDAERKSRTDRKNRLAALQAKERADPESA